MVATAAARLAGRGRMGYVAPMPLVLVFLMGIANFALYRAVMESDHPVLAELSGKIRTWLGPWGLYALEAVVLVAALWFARQGSVAAALLYGLYLAANIGSFMLLRRIG
ncbi:MAG: hypothetical protein H7X93_13045 [Sphingomonadaceae bacterium]|nr:hypothetical protein [Sphingomonadaceae bacterium]